MNTKYWTSTEAHQEHFPGHVEKPLTMLWFFSLLELETCPG